MIVLGVVVAVVFLATGAIQIQRRDHFDFMDKMRDHDVKVVELHNVLCETMEIADARAWLLDRKIVANEVGLGLVDDTREFLDSLQPRRLAKPLVGGMSTRDLPADITSWSPHDLPADPRPPSTRTRSSSAVNLVRSP